MLIRRVARPMLASIFVVGGVDAIRHPGPRAEVAKETIDTTVAVLPNNVTDKAPTDPETLVRINGAVQVAGGVLLATGKFPRVASLALAGSLVPTTIAGHDFWSETDPAVRKQQRTQFFKNVSLLGGLLIAAVDTEGKPSLAWRGKRKADEVGQAVAAAIPFGAGAAASASAWDGFKERAEDGAHVLGERTSVAADRLADSAHVAADKSADAAEKLRKRAPGLIEAARERSAEAADLISKRAPELAEVARERSAEAADLISKRAPELAEAARERSAEAAEIVRDRAPEIAESARTIANTARDRAVETADEGRRRWRKATS